MSHGIINTRDFVYGLQGQGTDWHGLTQERQGPLTPQLFPLMEEEEIITRSGVVLPWKVLTSKDDSQPCGIPFNPKSFGYILPQVAWGMIEQALSGTHYTVERMGMLWDRSFWFVSVSLDELKEIARQGEAYQLNFSGGLDGNDSPQGELSHIRAVCWNTISASRRSGEYMFKIRQTSHSHDKLADAKSEVEKTVGLAALFNKTLAQLEAQKCTVDVARHAYAGDVARHGGDFRITKTKSGVNRENRSRNTVDELVSLFESGKGNSGETRADLLNGMTELMTRGRKDSKKNIWTTVASSEFGGNANRKATFLNYLTDEDEFSSLIEEGKEALATN
jgi:hypothetical protein